MSARGLAEMIQNYLEADDDGSSSSNGSLTSNGGYDSSGMRQQLQQLSDKTDKLQTDNDSLKKQLDSIQSNLQMSAILPLLLNQSLKVVSDNNPGGSANLSVNEVIEFAQSDPLSAMLPLLMMGGGLGGNGNGSGDSSNMLLLALAVSGSL